jgi:cellobiose transport system substrate-binding protein
VHVKEAWDFIQWYLAPEQQTKLFLDPKNGAFPTTVSAYSNPKVVGYKDPFFNNAPIGAIYSQSATTLKPIALGTKDRTIDNTFGQALSRVMLGKQSSSAAWGQALSDIKRAVG